MFSTHDVYPHKGRVRNGSAFSFTSTVRMHFVCSGQSYNTYLVP